MKRILLSVAVAIAGSLCGAGQAYVERVTTPHWAWEGAHTGGTVRALFMVYGHARRQVDELAQRFDMTVESVAVGGSALQAVDCDRERWANLMTQRWDVVVLAASAGWPALGITNQAALIEAMQAGQRVVVYNGQQGTNDNLNALIQGKPLANHADAVFRGLPVDRLNYRMPFQFREYAVGQGRLFLLDRIDTHWTRFNAFMGLGMQGVHALSWYDEPVTPESFYAAAGRWIRLAAGRQGELRVSAVRTPDAPASLGAPATFRFLPSGGWEAGDSLDWFLSSSFGDELARGSGTPVTGAVEAVVAPAQAGQLLLRWQWRRGSVTIDWGATAWNLTNFSGAFSSVTLPPVIQPEEPLAVQWAITGAVPSTASVAIRIYDPDGRLVSLAEGAVAAGRLTAPGWLPRSLSHDIRLFLRDGDRVFDERRLSVQVAASRTQDRAAFHAIVWGTEQGEYTDLFRLERLRELGITAFAPIGMNTNLNRIAASRGLRVVPTNILIPPGARKKTFNKPEEAKRLETFAAVVAPLSPLGYSLADEPGGVDPAAFQTFGAGVIRKQDPDARVGFCGIWEGYNRDVPSFFQACDFAEPYSPFHLYTPNLWMGCERDLYRSFMRPDAIVTCWTHYAPWLDNEPYSRTPPWLWLFDGLRGVSYFDSGGQFGVLPGDMRATHETRWWSQEVREIRNGIGEQLLASTRDAGAVRVLFHPNAAGAAAWARALNETRTPYRFISHAELERGVEPGVRLLICPQAPVLTDRELENVKAFVEAGGTLAATAPFGRYRPAPPAKPVEKKVAAPSKADELDGLLNAIDKPAPAVEPKEPDPIDPWIREISKPNNPVPEPAEGGRVEALCGIRYDGSTGAVPMASLVVTRRAPEAAGVPVEIRWSESAVTMTGTTLGVYGFVPAGSGRAVASMRETAEATNSTAAEIASARATPALVESACGKGRAWYLAAQPDVASLRAWLPALLAGAGVPEPESKVTLQAGSNDTVYAFRFADGPIRLVGVVQDYWKVGPSATVTGGVETALYFQHGPAVWGESPAVLSLSGAAHLYDVRRGKYMGFEKAVSVSIQPGRPELYACLPYRVAGVALSAPGKAVPGEVMELGMRLEGDAREWGNHVVHVELADPEGRVVEADRYNVHTKGGKGTVRVPLAWNALPGDWTLTARDSISGVSARSVLRVEPAKPLFRSWRKEPVVVERVPVNWPEGKLIPTGGAGAKAEQAGL